jgi:hypothetical protein
MMAIELRLTCPVDKLGAPEQLLKGLRVLNTEAVCTQIRQTGHKSSSVQFAVPLPQARSLLKKYSGWCPYSHAGAMCSIKAVAVTDPKAFSVTGTTRAAATQQPATTAASAAKHSSSASAHSLLSSMDELSSAKDNDKDDDTLCDIGQLYTTFLRASSHVCELPASSQSIGIGYRLSNAGYPAAGYKSGQPHLEQEQQQFVRQQRERVLMRCQQSEAQAKRSARSHNSSNAHDAKANRYVKDSSDSEPERYSSSKQQQQPVSKHRHSSSREQHRPLVAEAKSSRNEVDAYSKSSQDEAVFSCEHWPESPRIAAFTAKLAEQRQERAAASLSEVALALQQLQRRLNTSSSSSSSSSTSSCEPSLTQLRAVLKQLYSSGAVFAHNPPGVAHTLDMLGVTRHIAAPWQHTAISSGNSGSSTNSNSSSSSVLLWTRLLRRAVGHVRRFLSFGEFLLLARCTVLQSQLQRPKQQREAKGWGSAELAQLDAAIDNELTALAAAQQQQQLSRSNDDRSSAAASAQDSADAANVSWLYDSSTSLTSSDAGIRAVKAAFAAHAVPGTASAAPVVHISGAVAVLWQLGWSLPQEAVWRWRVTSSTDAAASAASSSKAGATHDSEYLDWASFTAMCTALRAGMQQLPECADQHIDWSAMTQQLQRLQPAAVAATSATGSASTATAVAAEAVVQLPKRRESAQERERREKLCAAAAKRADPAAANSKHTGTATTANVSADRTAAAARHTSAVAATVEVVAADSSSTAVTVTQAKSGLQPDVVTVVAVQTSTIEPRTASAPAVTADAAQRSVTTEVGDVAMTAADAAVSSGAAAVGSAAGVDKHVIITP